VRFHFIVFVIFITALLALTVSANASSFDKPLRTQVVKSPQEKRPPNLWRAPERKVSCYYFKDFMVKEVDLGEKGAASLSIVTTKHTAPSCTRKRLAGEVVITWKTWSGYFLGVKDRFVFFDASDGTNGGMGFAVFDSATSAKLFEDVRLGELEFEQTSGQPVTLRYRRMEDPECSLLTDPDACWDKIKKLLGDDVAKPDCRKGYEKSAHDLAKGRCEAQGKADPDCMARELKLATEQTSQATSIIAYPVERILGPKPAIRNVAGATQCWPSD